MAEGRAGPLVSVIMTFLDAERFIEEAIASVQAQSYATWELLLVNDGSRDDSPAIARQYARHQPERIHYLEHPGHDNRGMSASRNLGIQHSLGPYLAFLDADDVYLPDKLERQVAMLNANPTAGMVYGGTQYWYSWSARPEDQRRDRPRTLGLETETLYHPPELVLCFLQHTARTPGTGSVLIRRRAALWVGGFEEAFRGMFEDQVFFHKLCLQMPVYVHAACVARYRQHPDSWSQRSLRAGEWRQGDRMNRAHAAFLNWQEYYLRAQGVSDRRLWRALKRELWGYRHPRLYRWLTPFRGLRRPAAGPAR